MRRPLFWTGLTFLSSAAVFLRFSAIPAIFFCIAAALLGLLFSGAAIKKGLLLFAVCAVLGCLYAFVYTTAVNVWLSPIISAKDQTMPFVLTVTEQTRRGSYGQWRGRGTVTVNGITRSYSVLLKGYTESEAAPGQVFTGTARLSAAFSGQELPLQLIALQDVSEKSPHSFTQKRIQWQQALSARAAALSRQADMQGVLSAVLTGDRSRLLNDTTASFRKSGLSHLLVVSGLHLVLVSRMILLLLSRLMPPRSANLFATVLWWVFVVISGMGSSVIRAAIMLSLVHLAESIQRRGDTLTSLMVAALLMGLIDPYVLYSAAFLLSFGAVAGLATLERPIRSLLESKFAHTNSMSAYLLQNLAVGIAAQAGVAPVVIAIFGTVPLLGIAANLAAIWLIEPIMLVGFFALLLSFISPPLAAVAALPCNAFIRLLLIIARFFAQVPFAQLGFTEMWQFLWLGGCVFLLTLIYTKRAPRFVVSLAILGCCAAGLTVAVLGTVLTLGTADILLFKSSNTAAIVTGNRAVLLGSPQNGYQLYEIQTVFNRLGVEYLEAVVVDSPTQAVYHTAALMQEYPGAVLCAPATRSTVTFAHAAGIPLRQLPKQARFLGAEYQYSDSETILAFSNAKLLKTEGNYVIIGKYAAKALSETVVCARTKL